MIDELDLAFDEHADRGGIRSHRRGGSTGGKKRRGKTGVAFLMAFVLLAVLGGGVFLGYNKVKNYFTAADYDGSGSDPVQVAIEQNATLTDIGNTLVDSDVVKSTKAFIQVAEKNPRSKNIQSGTYNMKKQMSAENAVTLLLDPKSRVSKGVTITEGQTALQTYALLSKATKIPEKDFQAAAKDPIALGVPDWWFKRTDGKPVAKTIEGFLYPDTYEFDPSMDATDILKTMVDRFNTVVGDMGFADTVQHDLTVSPFEGLIVASLTQAESGIASDDPKIARVAYNRAYKKDMPLQFDTTTNYYLELKGGKAKHSGQLTQSELSDPKNPYNTATKKGLPVGPIDSPGKVALQAAMKPATGDYVFFVAIDKEGHSAFASTNDQHCANIKKAIANGIPLSPC
ncbi:endolytic transglycosylase MltG [Actinoplanes sp. TBRC 11911]|uniref:endolytic transglycosylase MltG n=1 Tax=Actinoplanes sp. TBRC 11911 TaxID=2729386 RepID=UPI00145C7A5F|nr:endolytic transglycosylase MltG [Actinoplanes sp. TBRC 11911]NMO56297.1 endolytic transglycosylase MltG [Actinoplanes sp. TBRC 11911]